MIACTCMQIVTSGDPPQEYEITPLALAAGRGKLNMVEFLVENKANVNYCSSVSNLKLLLCLI